MREAERASKMSEYFIMIEKAQACPDRYTRTQTEFAKYIYTKLIRLDCKQWSLKEVKAVVKDYDANSPKGILIARF